VLVVDPRAGALEAESFMRRSRRASVRRCACS
jgi:hypothetical protein